MVTRCQLCGEKLPLRSWFGSDGVCAPCGARREAARQAGLRQYQAAVTRALSDLAITPQEWTGLQALQGRLGLAPQEVLKAHQHIFELGYGHVARAPAVTQREVTY